MEVKNTLASISGDPAEDGHVVRFDTVLHDGHWWLVPEWLEAHATGQRVPALLIRPATGLVQDDQTTFSSPRPVPKAALDGNQVQGWIVVLFGAQTLPPAGSVQ